MDHQSIYFKILLEKFKDLVEIAIKKKYTFLVPIPKFISTNLLTRNFYDNHIFYQCEYDEKIYINLNGKAIELSSTNQFQTYLGFRKNMAFNVIEQVKMELLSDVVNIVYIDNVIDENYYTQTNTGDPASLKKDVIKRCVNKDDYISAFNSLVRKNEELREIEHMLNEFCERLQNNYILIKNHTGTYSKFFKELGQEFRQNISEKMQRFKIDDSYNVIIYELSESLIFSKLHSFIFMNLKNFNLEDESDFKNRLNSFKSDFSFTYYKLDQIFNECKFKTAIEEIKKMSKCQTPFEKMTILTQVNALIEKEAKECVLKNSYKKKNFQPNADELIPMWIYVIINSELADILAECIFLQDFKLRDHSLMSHEDYSLISFLSAVDQIKKETNMGKPVKAASFAIQPIVITSRAGNIDYFGSGYESMASRSSSMSTVSSKKI